MFGSKKLIPLHVNVQQVIKGRLVLGSCFGKVQLHLLGMMEYYGWLVGGLSIFYFHPYLGKWSNLTNIFQRGWNHQLDDYPEKSHPFFPENFQLHPGRLTAGSPSKSPLYSTENDLNHPPPWFCSKMLIFRAVHLVKDDPIWLANIHDAGVFWSSK